MGPEKWKGEAPSDETAEAGRRAGRGEEQGQGAPRGAPGADAGIERREDEGYAQPESSAQKTPRRPEDEELGE